METIDLSIKENFNTSKGFKIIRPITLIHFGRKKTYPSKYLWFCKNCNALNSWQTKILHGSTTVICEDCNTKYTLDKSNPIEEVTNLTNKR